MSESNISSNAALDFYAVVIEEMTPEQLVRTWNKHLKREAVCLARIKNEASKSRVESNYKRLRKELRTVNEELFERITDTTDEGGLRLKASAKEPAKASKASKADTLQTPPNLTALERSILLSCPIESRKNDLVLTEEDKKELTRMADEAMADLQKRQEFIGWACRLADSEADALKLRKGERLWDKAVTVEIFPVDPTKKIIMVRSSTAPLLGDQGPIVKHDYRANGKPVKVNHEKMFRQADQQKLIRSRVLVAKSHEYYVKCLDYQEGMYFKGYFEVNGIEQQELTRYFVVRNNNIVPINEMEYRELENKTAALGA